MYPEYTAEAIAYLYPDLVNERDYLVTMDGENITLEWFTDRAKPTEDEVRRSRLSLLKAKKRREIRLASNNDVRYETPLFVAFEVASKKAYNKARKVAEKSGMSNREAEVAERMASGLARYEELLGQIEAATTEEEVVAIQW